MKVHEMFPSRFATGHDLAGPVTLTVARVAQETMRPGGGQPVAKWVIYFAGAKRGVVLTRTLAYQIAQALGADDTDAWPGGKVTLYPERVTVAGVERVVIRARAPRNGNGGM